MINDILQKYTIKADLGFGVDYYKGEPGEQGIPGKDGKTPVKGVDYWTAADQTSIINQLKSATFSFDSSTGALSITL